MFLLAFGDQSVFSQSDSIRVNTDLVIIPVTVIDRDGRFLGNLAKENFNVEEQGIPQQIDFFETVKIPFTVSLLLDVSGTMLNHDTALAKAASAFVKALRPDDSIVAAAFAYERYPLISLTKVSDLKTGLKLTMRPLDPGTLVFDAVRSAAKELQKVRGRKALILFSDGVGEEKFATAKNTLRDAVEGEIIIYTIQFPLPSNPPFTEEKKLDAARAKASNYMTALAEVTGGRHFFVNDLGDLEMTFREVADELGSQYRLGYYPTVDGRDGERRRITVKVNVPNVAVRSRNEVIYKKSKK